MHRRLLKLCREAYGNDPGPRICEVELKESGVVITQATTRTEHQWGAAKDLEFTGDSVDIRFNGGLLVVRDRAFPTAADKTRFFELAKTYRENSKRTQP